MKKSGIRNGLAKATTRVHEAFAAGRLLDAERGMHHHHHDDAEALGVVRPVDAPAGVCVGIIDRLISVPMLSHIRTGRCIRLYTIKDRRQGSSIIARINAGDETSAPPLPIDAALPELTAALRARNAAVLVAPPGAGKTTRVPLVLAGEPGRRTRRSSCWSRAGSPPAPPPSAWRRRWANAVGDTVGYRVRFGSKVSRRPGSRWSPRACSPA